MGYAKRQQPQRFPNLQVFEIGADDLGVNLDLRLARRAWMVDRGRTFAGLEQLGIDWCSSSDPRIVGLGASVPQPRSMARQRRQAEYVHWPSLTTGSLRLV